MATVTQSDRSGPSAEAGAQAGTDGTARADLRHRRFRDQPRVLRLVVLGGVLVALATVAAVLTLLPGPSWSATLGTSAFWWIAGVAVAADLYRLLPWVRRTAAAEGYLWTTALGFAAVLVAGPKAIVIWIASSLLTTVACRMRPWRVVYNIAQYSAQAAAAAALLSWLDVRLSSGLPWETLPSSSTLPAVIGAALAARLVNCAAIMAADRARGRSAAESFDGWLRTGACVAVVHIAAAPLLAAAAIVVPSLLPLGGVLGLVAYHRLAKARQATQEARLDPLTGLVNRGAFFTAVDARLRAAAEPPTVLVLDLDHFKQVNDELGHLGGDAVLLEAATRLDRGVRAEDVVARIGGDEFAVLVAGGTDRTSARALAERVLHSVVGTYRAGGQDFTISASVGMARSSVFGESVKELVDLADRAMYSAKRRGGGLAVHQSCQAPNRADQIGTVLVLPGRSAAPLPVPTSARAGTAGS